MPHVSAGNFIVFASASHQRKRSLVSRAVANGKWPGYARKEDYWVAVRNVLKRLIKSGDWSKATIVNESARFNPDRQAEAVNLLMNFGAAWKALGAERVDGPRFLAELGGFTIGCAPHAKARIGRRRLALRFSYSQTTLLSRDEKTHLELLCLGIGKKGFTPAVINVRTGTVLVSRRDPMIVQYVRAEAGYLATLWRSLGGPP